MRYKITYLEQTTNRIIGGIMERDKELTDEMYHEEELKDIIKPYAVAFAVVIFGILPWAVGASMLIKWIIF